MCRPNRSAGVNGLGTNGVGTSGEVTNGVDTSSAVTNGVGTNGASTSGASTSGAVNTMAAVGICIGAFGCAQTSESVLNSLPFREKTFSFNAIGDDESIGCAIRELELLGFHFDEPQSGALAGRRPLPPPNRSALAYELVTVELDNRLLKLEVGIVRRSEVMAPIPEQAGTGRGHRSRGPVEATAQEIESVGQLCAAV